MNKSFTHEGPSYWVPLVLRNNIFTQKETYSHLLLIDAKASRYEEAKLCDKPP
jgi:hypothetical protein